MENKNTKILIIFVCYMTDKRTIWDPLRKKNVALTPEENVRQWFIRILSEHMQVPVHMMMSEVAFKLGEKSFRADVIVYDRSAKPLMVVECKRPEVDLTGQVLDQAIRYNMVLDVRYIVITNGTRTVLFQKSGNGYVPMDKLPIYSEMLCQQ